MTIDADRLEKIIIALIFLTLSVTFIFEPDVEIKEEIVINETSFNEFPLVAWKTIHKKWDGTQADIVKIKYRVTRENTKLWVYDTKTNNLVHEQSIVRHPWSDGKPRDFIWVWKLYKTERTRYIPPGEYEIVVGGLYEGGFGQLKTRITI